MRADIDERVASFDRTWSRFRDDSLVARISTTAGRYVFPSEAPALFDLYRRLYEATDGAVSPLVGRALETLGYDRDYSLRPGGAPSPVPAWDDAVSWDGEALTALRPVGVDVGAAGKGYLVDLVSELLTRHGVTDHVVDASGDMVHAGAGSLRVALEHPRDATKAIGLVELRDQALASSATNRRTWGDGLHHVIDVTTGLPTSEVVATWAIAADAGLADGLATALFFAGPELERHFAFEWVRMFSDGRSERHRLFAGELFS